MAWGQIAAAAVGGILGRQKQSIPKPKTAEQMKADMDTMYAGTTPWERLGASGGGVPQAAAAQDQTKIAARIQQQQHRNQMQIAGINAAASMYKSQLDYKAKIKGNPFASVMDPDTALEGVKEGYNNVKEGVENFIDKHIVSKDNPSQSVSDKPSRANAGVGTKKSIDFGEAAKSLVEKHSSPQPGGKRKRSNKRR